MRLAVWRRSGPMSRRRPPTTLGHDESTIAYSRPPSVPSRRRPARTASGCLTSTPPLRDGQAKGCKDDPLPLCKLYVEMPEAVVVYGAGAIGSLVGSRTHECRASPQL